MKRTVRLIALVSLSIFALGPPEASAQPGKVNPAETHEEHVDVGGHKLHLQVGGSGTPTVVFESGLGDDLGAWRSVFTAVTAFSRAVAYDRAGYGKSDPGPEPRSYAQVATELHAMLRRSDLPPPYVLVGHSLGGAYLRAFAHLFKDEVAGIVFVDPFSEDMVASASAKDTAESWKSQDAAAERGRVGLQSEWAFMKKVSGAQFP